MFTPDKKDEFLQLLLQNMRQIYAYTRSLVPNAADAEDILQEVSVVLWRKFDQFRPGSNFLAWALQVAWRTVQEYRRRLSRDRLRFSDAALADLALIAERETGPISTIQEALRHCLSLLDPEARDLLVRRCESNVTIAEIAADVGRPVETVRSVLKRARRAVFECIQRQMAMEAHP